MKKILPFVITTLVFAYSLNAQTPYVYRDSLKAKADQGDAFSQYALGLQYLTTPGVEETDQLAASWIRHSAEQGFLEAQVALADLYRKGQGLPQDLFQAYVWSSIAALRGDAYAARLKVLLAEKLATPQVKQAEDLAQAWKSKR
ncbi:MAG: tetratricopeptide repeat protein [Deltaproteobacteria bacterium]